MPTANTDAKRAELARAVGDLPDLDYGHVKRADAGKYPVPADRADREHLARRVREYVRDNPLVPPLLMEELEAHADRLVAADPSAAKYREFFFVLLNNEAWRPIVASIPCHRRTLLLPPCLRASDRCKAKFDKIGLLCERCGQCKICGLSDEAEDLGYTVLVAEGTTVVGTLVERGKIDAVIGVSCMPALERSFPRVAVNAVPSIAIPLLRDGCKDTLVDDEWVRDALHLNSGKRRQALLDLGEIHSLTSAWFTADALRLLLKAGHTETEEIALEWLAKSGKRWRPFLTVCVYKALREGPAESMPEPLRRVAIAVECIHKASLIYDDIQDGDKRRYGEPTVHSVHGVPVAMTAALYLLGHGYRLIAECGAAPETVARMLALATQGHCDLCLGQGAELCWTRKPAPLSAEQVLGIFRQKTAPSFDVVFRLGALCADADPQVHDVLRRYSEALGVAYQIHDDLDDFTSEGDVDDIEERRPSIVLALAYGAASPAEREVIASVWLGTRGQSRADEIRGIIQAHGVADKTRALLEDYKQQALRALIPLRNADLKMVLCRIVSKVFRSSTPS
jgi:geranylgeranyl pyrophosphate synthase